MNSVRAYTLIEAAKAAGVSKSHIYRQIACGKITARKIGRRTVILVSEFERWLGSLDAVSAISAYHGVRS